MGDANELPPLLPGLDAGPRPATRAAVFAALARGTRPAAVVEVVGRAVDQIWEEHRRRRLGVLPACARGCSSCCHQRVEVTAPEVVALAEHLRAALDDEALARARERIDGTARALRGVDGRAHHEQQIRCALLDDDGACLAHAGRPLACRRAHSTDRAACDAAHAEPTAKLRIPNDPTLSWNTAAVVLGYLEGLEHAGRPIDVFELHAALAVALARDDVAGAWARGEDPFAEARTQTSDEVRRALGGDATE